MADDREKQEKPHTIVARIKGLIAGMRTTSPSGSETLHQKLSAELANLDEALGPAPARDEPVDRAPLAAQPSNNPFSPKARTDDTVTGPTPGAPSP